jgi:hypothetical protein
MIYGEWVESEIDHYQQELARLEDEYTDKTHPQYQTRRASIEQSITILESLREPIESDQA